MSISELEIEAATRAIEEAYGDALDIQSEAIAKAALEAAARARWRPIETAPKDGTKILALCQPKYVETGRDMSFNYINVVWWRGKEFKESMWKWRHSLSDSAAEPTHWQPLPEPPESKSK